MPILIIAADRVLVAMLALLAFSYWRAAALLRPVRSPMAYTPADVGLEMETVSFASPRG